MWATARPQDARGVKIVKLLSAMLRPFRKRITPSVGTRESGTAVVTPWDQLPDRALGAGRPPDAPDETRDDTDPPEAIYPLW